MLFIFITLFLFDIDLTSYFIFINSLIDSNTNRVLLSYFVTIFLNDSMISKPLRKNISDQVLFAPYDKCCTIFLSSIFNPISKFSHGSSSIRTHEQSVSMLLRHSSFRIKLPSHTTTLLLVVLFTQ